MSEDKTGEQRVRNEVAALVREGQSLLQPFFAWRKDAKGSTAPHLAGTNYEEWYTKSLAVIKQLAPDRLVDFTDHYSSSQKNKKLQELNDYRLADAMVGIRLLRYSSEDHSGLVAQRLYAQLSILKGVQARFDSAIRDIRGTLQAAFLDSGLETAGALLKAHQVRSAGTLAGVVLERHLSEVVANHKIDLKKKKPTLSDYYDGLKNADAIEVATWRNLQYLSGVRNLCAHNGEREPTKDEVSNMIAGVTHIVKTLF